MKPLLAAAFLLIPLWTGGCTCSETFLVGDPWDADDGCRERDLPVMKITPRVLILLDRSTSMYQDDFWVPTREAVVTMASRYEDDVMFGLTVFPDSGCDGQMNDCSPGGQPLVEFALGNASVIGGILSGMTTCGGTPLADTLLSAHDYLSGVEGDWDDFILLATDGAPNCNVLLDGPTCRCTCLDPDMCVICSGGPRNCLDETRTYRVLDTLRDDGVKTFVVGLSRAAEEWGDILDGMAAHGGTGSFYPADDPDRVEEIFDTITSMVLLCEYSVDMSGAPDRELVNLYFDGMAVPRDASGRDGWDWEGEGRVRFQGASCDRIVAGEVGSITGTYGCPTIDD